MALCIVAVGAPGLAGATVSGPQPQRQVRPVPAPQWQAVRVGPHVFYGTITAVRGSLLVVRLRTGRFQAVDAAAAIAHGDCSQPLFVGKLVSVDGNEVGTKFLASHVFRMSNLADLRPDR